MKNIFCTVLILLLLTALPLTAGEVEEEPLVSTLFYQTDIREALNEVALQTGINIIPDETVRGVITMDLEDVPLEKALEMMLISGGYTYQKIDDYYLVGLPDSRSRIFQHLVETETIKLNYISASEAHQLLPSFYDGYYSYSTDRDLFNVSAPRPIIENLKEDLAQIDRPQKQVLIKAIVTEISTEVLKERGADLFQLTAEKDQVTDHEGEAFFSLERGTLNLGSDIYGELLSRLRILEGEQEAKIRANPRILVSDREMAQLFVGEERIIFLNPNDEDTHTERVDVGVSLEVTPRILRGDGIQISIEPDISHFTQDNQSGLVVRRSEMSTTVFTKSGETMILAGITVEEESDYESRVPILGRIPLVRWLFMQSSERVSERELLVFLTPEIQTESVDGGFSNDYESVKSGSVPDHSDPPFSSHPGREYN